MKKEEIINLLHQLKDEIRKEYKAEIKGIFGSFVRGEEKPGSDLDVLVEFDKGANLLHLTGLSIFLEQKLGIPVDIVPVDAVREEIKEHVLKEAVYL